MRIGMLADNYKPRINGITNYVALNKAFLEKRGHEVYVFTFGDEDYQDDEAGIIRSPAIPLLDTGYYLSLSYSPAARKLLRGMDVVHIHHPFVSGSVALPYCRRRGIPVAFTNHTRYDLYAQAYMGEAAIIGETALQAYLPPFCRACDLVISPSPGMRAILIKMGVDAPIEVVPNGVDLHRFQKAIEPLKRQQFGFDPDQVVLIYTGRLGPEKNVNFLLRSFAGAALAYSHVRLLVVGDGPERASLQDLAQRMNVADKVVFTGMVPYEAMPRYLAMADAFVTASVTEVHPLSLIEAMAAGLPLLGIASPGVGDIIQDGFNGYLSPEADLAAFTAKLVRLATEHIERRQMGMNACRGAEEYSIENTTELMEQHYLRLVELSKPRRREWHVRWTRSLDRWQ